MTRIRNIKDLADLAGVSAGTVSRALAGSDLISAKTRERIQSLADAHGFRPNVMARNLRIQRTGAIGVLIPLGHATGQHISDPFFITMLGLIADALTERGYDLLLSRVVPRDADWLDHYVSSGRVDGVIVIGQSDQAEVLDRVAAHYKPLVVWGGHRPGQLHCSVGSDNAAGGGLAARHLIARGCRRIAFLGDPCALEIGQRLEGCSTALAEAGLPPPIVVPVKLEADRAWPEISAFLAGAPQPPDGIVAASDVIAMTALRALSEAGLSVPGQVRVIGYDGLAFGEQTLPPLTSVRQDLTAGAALLVDKLLRRIAGEDAPYVMMAPDLLVRASS
ncbi:MAG: LacI family DNA-binding transcriptional regulator [Proteobacteria bacterium]|nr:LacI family DNA-binding transcriptional regulator [Pseudomonadota bacterium]